MREENESVKDDVYISSLSKWVDDVEDEIEEKKRGNKFGEHVAYSLQNKIH